MNRRDLRLRLRALLLRHRVEHELDEELQFHLAVETRRNLDRGMSEAEANRKARLTFGQIDQVKDACRMPAACIFSKPSGRTFAMHAAASAARPALRSP